MSIRASSPSQNNRRAARRLKLRMSDEVCRLGMACCVCQGRLNGAEMTLRAVLRRTDEPNLREFCRAALEELRGK